MAEDWPINNWIATLKAAWSAMSQLAMMSDEPDQNRPLHLCLLGDLYRISGQFNGMKILFNVQIAAIGLYFILQGKRAMALVNRSHNIFDDFQDIMVGFPSDLQEVGSL